MFRSFKQRSQDSAGQHFQRTIISKLVRYKLWKAHTGKLRREIQSQQKHSLAPRTASPVEKLRPVHLVPVDNPTNITDPKQTFPQMARAVYTQREEHVLHIQRLDIRLI